MEQDIASIEGLQTPQWEDLGCGVVVLTLKHIQPDNSVARMTLTRADVQLLKRFICD
jgi:hypothetical protein